MATSERQHLAAAISKYLAQHTYCARIDQEIEAKEAAALKQASQERADAQHALELETNQPYP